jgi:hypothetical protein
VQALYESAETGKAVQIPPFRAAKQPTRRQRIRRPGVSEPALVKGEERQPMTGVSEGEESRPPHPRRDDLARLLLERDAEPYDSQAESVDM